MKVYTPLRTDGQSWKFAHWGFNRFQCQVDLKLPQTQPSANQDLTKCIVYISNAAPPRPPAAHHSRSLVFRFFLVGIVHLNLVVLDEMEVLEKANLIHDVHQLLS